MKLLSQATEEKELDVRIMERKRSSGIPLDSKQLQSAKNLPDDADAGTFISLSDMMASVEGHSVLRKTLNQ